MWLREHNEDLYEELYGGVQGKGITKKKKRNFDIYTFLIAGVTEGVEKATIEDETLDKKDRSLVKDKSAKLEAKLERENKKKMVTREKGCLFCLH